MPPRCREVGFLVDSLDEAMVAAEEGLGADERRVEVDPGGKFIDWFVYQ